MAETFSSKVGKAMDSAAIALDAQRKEIELLRRVAHFAEVTSEGFAHLLRTEDDSEEELVVFAAFFEALNYLDAMLKMLKDEEPFFQRAKVRAAALLEEARVD